VDERLREVFGAFDTLLQVTPVNADEAWERFKASGHGRAPELRYRPLPFDPESLKRRLFHVPIERVEDPLLCHLFREKQEELDREITLLREIGTERFLPASVQLHGGVDDDLLETARAILDRLSRSGPASGSDDYPEDDDERPSRVGAEEFAAAARAEIDGYREEHPAFTAAVEVRDDVAAGLMVSRGVLRVSSGLSLSRDRVEALIQHEVGTHVVTYFNGTLQPLGIFASGLAGYEPLQEGLAVLSEYLVGGLTPGRLRILAGRVVGVAALLDGADFVETYGTLRDAGFAARSSFVVTLRIHRGGGYTKDSVYLRGLRGLLRYLADDGPLDPLLVGKLGLDHSDAVQELVLREILEVPRVRPRWTTQAGSEERLERCRGMGILDLVDHIHDSSGADASAAST